MRAFRASAILAFKAAALRRAKVPYFRIYDLRSTYATRLSAGGVADEWVTQLLRQGQARPGLFWVVFILVAMCGESGSVLE